MDSEEILMSAAEESSQQDEAAQRGLSNIFTEVSYHRLPLAQRLPTPPESTRAGWRHLKCRIRT